MNTLDKIPVFVLTGFLGSGKTALLNAMLKQPRFADSAVVVNEFGEIGLDHLLVESARDNIVLLEAGCLCCEVQGSLKETLADLYQRRAQGTAPAFQRVLIETTGLADPAPILQSIMRDSLVSAFYRLAGLICVVDGLFGQDELVAHAEARAQVAFADILLVTKTDCTAGVCSPALSATLRRLNPMATILVASHGQIDAQALLGDGNCLTGAPWLGDMGAVAETGHDHGSSHSQLHDAAITTESFWITQPATWAGLAAWTDMARRRYGSDLLRCKGIIAIAGLAGPVVLHGVQSLFDTRRLGEWPDAERRSRLVIIGRNLDLDALAGSTRWLHAPEGTQPPLDPAEIAPQWGDA
jgi:G3E family GTPase